MMPPVYAVLITSIALSAAPAPPTSLHLHLPRQVQIEGPIVSLGQICVIRNAGQWTQDLSDLKLGQLFTANQEFVVDRAMITSRLVSQGIAPESITFTGAQRQVVRRRSQNLSGEILTEQARQFLLERMPYLSTCILEPARAIDSLNIGQTSKNLRIEPMLLSNPSSNQLRVRLIVQDGISEIAKQDIVFQVRYRTGHLVATAPIAKGQPLTPDNVTIKEGMANRPTDVISDIPYGQIVQVAIEPNSIIPLRCLQEPLAPVLIKRNSNVIIAINLPGLRITAMGTAIDEGRTGEVVKVRNNDSRRIILCKVNTDGSVEPIL